MKKLLLLSLLASSMLLVGCANNKTVETTPTEVAPVEAPAAPVVEEAPAAPVVEAPAAPTTETTTTTAPTEAPAAPAK